MREGRVEDALKKALTDGVILKMQKRSGHKNRLTAGAKNALREHLRIFLVRQIGLIVNHAAKGGRKMITPRDVERFTLLPEL